MDESDVSHVNFCIHLHDIDYLIQAVILVLRQLWVTIRLLSGCFIFSLIREGSECS